MYMGRSKTSADMINIDKVVLFNLKDKLWNILLPG